MSVPKAADRAKIAAAKPNPGPLGLGLVGRMLGLGRNSRAQDAPSLEQVLISVLSEAAAIIGEDGAILEANLAWYDLMGSGARLPSQVPFATDLFGAFAAARRGERAPASVVWCERPYTALVSLMPEAETNIGHGQAYLLRLMVQSEAQPAIVGAVTVVAEQPISTPTAYAEPMANQGYDHLADQGLDTFSAAAPFGAALLDGAEPLEALIIQSNQAFSAITGNAEQDSRFCDLIDPAARAEVAAQLAAGKAGPIDVRLAANPTGLAHLYVRRSGVRFVVYLIDVSEQKQMELQLAQSQKMQAIGQLAGGVAHDFNNLLTAIQLRLDELLHRHPVGDPSYEGLNEIRQTGVRAADLVRKLLAFSRKQTLQREVLDLGELISEFSVLLRRLLREDVKLETDYGRNLPMVRVDKSQLETAVMNLAVNARDAVRAQGGGIVKIRTARLSLDQAKALGYALENPGVGEVAMIEVADNGPGIPPEVLSKIFDPFFTTKPVGEGTGLGLATVYGIVKQADGWIHVDTGPGKGAAFRIFLKIHVPAVGLGLAPAPVAKAKPVARDLSGAGRILFVEDEDAVRGVAARLLRARGYEVIEACDGEEALSLAEEHAGKIDLLISDVIMPGIDGPTLLKRAREFLGTAPVMFISGYAEAEFSDLLEGETGVTFLPKPLDIKILAERVKQQLQAA